MTENLSTSIAKLRKSATQLNTISDQASDTVKEVEEFLSRKCGVGIPAWVKIKDLFGGVSGNEVCQWLEYRRVGDKFRIAVVTGRISDPENEHVKPWTECTRDEKLEAAAKLPELILEIGKKLDEQVESAYKAAAVAKEVLAALTGKVGG